MKGFKKWITSPVITVLLFVAAAGLLLFSTIGAALAIPQYFSETYSGHVEMLDIGVSLLEKSEHDEAAHRVAWRNYINDNSGKAEGDNWDETDTPDKVGVLLGNLIGEDEEFIPGKVYKEEISVGNTGTINEWVRVTLYKYWVDPSGNKVIAYDGDRTGSLPSGMAMADSEDSLSTYGLSPDLIVLSYPNLDDGSGNGSWIRDTQSSSQTEERTVFYYNKLLRAGEDTTQTPLTGTLSIDGSVAQKVSQTKENDGKTIVTTFLYDGWRFCLEADVDAVQERNAVSAIKSAWGRDVSIGDNGILKLE